MEQFLVSSIIGVVMVFFLWLFSSEKSKPEEEVVAIESEKGPNVKGPTPLIYIILIILGCLLYFYYRYPAPLVELIGGILGISFGAAIFGFIPYIFLRSRIKSPKIKVFAVTFFLANLLLVIAFPPA